MDRKSAKKSSSGGEGVDSFLKVENARRLLLEGLRHHPDSREIFREYFCLELGYVETLNAEKKNEDEDSKEDEIRDGKIAEIVLKQAFEAVQNDATFEAELLAIIFHFPIARVRSHLFSKYQDWHGSKASTWDQLGRLQLLDRLTDDGRSVADKIDHSCEIYKEGLAKLVDDPDASTDLFGKFVSTLLHLTAKVAVTDEEKMFMTEKFFETFELGKSLKVLSQKDQKLFKEIFREDVSNSDDDSD